MTFCSVCDWLLSASGNFNSIPGCSRNVEETVKNISKRIEDLVFLDQEKQLQVFFTIDKAKITLYLKDRKSSQFDMLIGFLPNSNIGFGVFFVNGSNLVPSPPARITAVLGIGRGTAKVIKTM